MYVLCYVHPLVQNRSITVDPWQSGWEMELKLAGKVAAKEFKEKERLLIQALPGTLGGTCG